MTNIASAHYPNKKEAVRSEVDVQGKVYVQGEVDVLIATFSPSWKKGS